jgi:hypothetical protein
MDTVNPDEPTLLSLQSAHPSAADFVREAEEALQGSVTLFGELGRSDDGTVALLGRDQRSQRLVAVRIRSLPGAHGSYQADVLKELDSSLPELRSECPACHSVLQAWTPFCPFCAADLSRVAVSRSGRSRSELLELVQRASTGRYEVLGEMNRREGGGLIYFGRDVNSGELVAMRLMETVETSDRRTGGDRRAGEDRRKGGRRTREEAVPKERRESTRPKYSLDLTEIDIPLDDGREGQ